jgi:LysR family transcriptional regulator, transcription activator of glutamate synthase operon
VIEVSKEMSVTKAAKGLHVSPSAISQAISILEKELGFNIFTRSKVGMVPTPEDHLVISKAYDILADIHELHEEIALYQKKVTNIIKVACTPSMTYTVYVALLTFRENIGEYNIVIEEMGQDSLLMKLKEGEVDLAFSVFREEELENKCNNLGIDYENIYRGHVCACVNSSHSLAQRGIVTTDDLRMEKLVMYNSNYIKDFYRKYLNGNEILLISNNSELLRLSVLNEYAVLLLLNLTLNRHVDVIDLGQLFQKN